MNKLQRFFDLPPSSRKSFFDKLGYYNYALCELDENNRRIPFYIGKGKGERCLQHFKEIPADEKGERILKLIKSEKISIDILAYNIDEKTAFSIESVCIDLLGIENLNNKVRGHGADFKRLPIYELSSILMGEEVSVLNEHKGVAFLLEKTFDNSFGDLELLEHTRGIWRRKQPPDVKYAFATFRGVVKEVYEIHSWVPAGTQEYFTRNLDPKKAINRFEFVGKKAPDQVRDRYVGNLIQKRRSYGDPFVKVGFD
jgi:hypothetical protein